MRELIDKLKRGVKKVAKAVVDALKALLTVVSNGAAKIMVGVVCIGASIGVGAAGAVLVEEGIHDRKLERKVEHNEGIH